MNKISEVSYGPHSSRCFCLQAKHLLSYLSPLLITFFTFFWNSLIFFFFPLTSRSQSFQQIRFQTSAVCWFVTQPFIFGMLLDHVIPLRSISLYWYVQIFRHKHSHGGISNETKIRNMKTFVELIMNIDEMEYYAVISNDVKD